MTGAIYRYMHGATPRAIKRLINQHRFMKMVAFEHQDSKDSTLSHDDGKLVIWAFLCWRWREQMKQILPDEKSSMV